MAGADTDTHAPLATAEWVARRLGVRVHRVYALAREGTLPCVRIGSRQLRFSPEAIEEFIERGGSAGNDA